MGADDLGPARVAELDRGDMLGAVAGLSRQLAAGYAVARHDLAEPYGKRDTLPRLPSSPTSVAVAGMGGSAIGADLVFASQPGLTVPSVVVRGYELPAWVGPSTLVVAVSYSGNTEETLACIETALARGCTPLCIASGGRLAALAAERRLPLITVPPGLQPRAALGYLSMPLLAALERLELIPAVEKDVEEAAAVVRETAALYAPTEDDDCNLAKDLAHRLYGLVPLVYGAGLSAPAARRWKTQLNENAKTSAFWAELPELDHNEIEAWGGLSREDAPGRQTAVVFLHDGEEGERLLRRATLTAEAVTAAGASVERVESRGGSRLARLFSLVTLGDHVSVYLGLLNGVDPTPVQAIERFKQRLAGEA